jgi:hypothetical protein
MGVSGVGIFLLVAASSLGDTHGYIQSKEVDYQSEVFQRWWGTELNWKFDELPEKGACQKFRVPYSGCDYTDAGGGTAAPLAKYDLAFHGGRSLAASYERWDTESHREGPQFRSRFLRALTRGLDRTPHWYGHCNGRTAATIRHAEPQNSVVRNGVTFTPADIKGLLADLYMYCDTEFLGGVDYTVNPGTFHVVLANWLGRGKHPIGMESTPGEEVWNYPIYAYASTNAKRSNNRVEVKINIAYVDSTAREYNQSPEKHSFKYLHYMLQLDGEGKIVGGSYFRDSSQIDMLWTPLQPRQGGTEGNERGNPHVNAKEVLALWRESVPEETREMWFNIDPTPEDRILPPSMDVEVVDVEDEEEESTTPSETEDEVAEAEPAANEEEVADADDSDATVAELELTTAR